MKKGETYIAEVVDTLYPNIGIVNCDGTPVRVKNAIKGQKIELMISKKRRSHIDGRLLKVVEKSELEITPSCKQYGKCGGCLYQCLPYTEELKLKKNQIKTLFEPCLKEQGIHIDDVFRGIIGSHDCSCYRNKMEYTFGDEIKDGPLTLGLHKRNSMFDIVSAEGCQLVHNDFSLVLSCVHQFANDYNLKHYHRLKHTGLLRHLLVRRTTNTEELMIALVMTTEEKINEEDFVKRLLDLKTKATIKSIMIIENDQLADAVKADNIRLLYGDDYITENILNLQFKISVFSFFQTNSKGAEVLYSRIRDLVGNNSENVVADLYCGTGTIAQIAASSAKQVVGVEIVESAIDDARENTKYNNIDNCTYYAMDVGEFLEKSKGDKSFSPNVIILDPPREGIRPAALKDILDYEAETIIYISCKSTSLLGELPEFFNAGYKLKSLEVVDMFPRTANVETVAYLSKVK